MDIKNTRAIRNEAAASLEASSGSGRLVLLYSCVLMGLNLLLTLLKFILGRQIGSAQGLDGMDLRTLLTTVQTLLDYASILLIPLWEAGIVFTAMCIYRRQAPEKQMLFRGFHRMGALFIVLILQSLAMNMIVIFCLQLSAMIYMASPLSAEFKAIMEPLLSQGPEAALDMAGNTALLGELFPMILLFLLLLGCISIPLIYRFRMAPYLVLDEPRTGPIFSLAESWRMTSGRCRSLFRLDLSFWWYYLLQALLAVFCYGDRVLNLLHISLPMAPDAASLMFYFLYAVLNIGFLCWAKLKIETAYAGAFDILRQTPRVLPAPMPHE